MYMFHLIMRMWAFLHSSRFKLALHWFCMLQSSFYSKRIWVSTHSRKLNRNKENKIIKKHFKNGATKCQKCGKLSHRSIFNRLSQNVYDFSYLFSYLRFTRDNSEVRLLWQWSHETKCLNKTFSKKEWHFNEMTITYLGPDLLKACGTALCRKKASVCTNNTRKN